MPAFLFREKRRHLGGTMHARHPMHRDDTGAAAVEFAIVSMLLIMLLVGIVQFGFLFNQWQQIEHAAREGARWASLGNGAADVRATVQAAAPGVGLAPGNIAISVDPAAAVPGTPVTVNVVTDAPVFTPLIGAFLGSGSSVRLTASATQRME